MDELKLKAAELLESKAVQVVIGYGESKEKRVHAIFVRQSSDCRELVYDNRCVQNLAVYLFKPEIRKLGKPALVAGIPALRSVLQLASEHQLTDDGLVVLAVSADGKLLNLQNFKAMEEYIAGTDVHLSPEEKKLLERIDKMSLKERWEFWQNELARCIKCYACRAACPMCYCSRCTMDCNQPQWIPSAAHQIGNLEWHINRAMHLAGRCVSCGECARACPLEIPLHLLTLKIAEIIDMNFGMIAGTSSDADYALSSFKIDDKETFIR
jgi:ferredoxin